MQEALIWQGPIFTRNDFLPIAYPHPLRVLAKFKKFGSAQLCTEIA